MHSPTPNFRVTRSMPEGVVTFHRQVLATPPRWEKSSSLFTSLHVDSEGTIEDHGHGMLQVGCTIPLLVQHEVMKGSLPCQLHLVRDYLTYDTCTQVLRFISKEKISGLWRWELNPQFSQLWCDALPVELPSPWEQGGGE